MLYPLFNELCVSESLKFSFRVSAFPFKVFYDTWNFFFVNFVVSTVFFLHNFAQEISSRDG